MSRIRFAILPPIDRPGEPVFVTGNTAELGNWDVERALRLTWRPPFHDGSIEADTGTHLEYKFLRGTWEKEAVDAWGNVPDNQRHDVWLDATLRHTVADWKDRYRGRLTTDHITSRLLAGERRLLIWLPTGYPTLTERRFPVIVFHDGANVFDPQTSPLSGVDWAADEWVSLLADHAILPESIVVGVCHPEGFAEDTVTLRDFDLALDLGGPAYAQFLTEELIPHLDTHYRTEPRAAARTLIGAGLGGALSFHTALRHPGVFGKFGCLSTTFSGLPDVPPADCPLLGALEALPELPANTRIFFDYGTEGPDAAAGPCHERLENALRSRGWHPGHTFCVRRIDGAEHSEISWRWRLGSALRFLAQ